MDFSYSDEQRMLADTLERLVTDASGDAATSPALWRTFAELGLLQLPFAEELGGLGGDGVDMMIVMQALGSGLVREPYLGGLLLPGVILARLADSAQRERWLTPLLAGEHQLALHGRRPRHATTRTPSAPAPGARQMAGCSTVPSRGCLPPRRPMPWWSRPGSTTTRWEPSWCRATAVASCVATMPPSTTGRPAMCTWTA
jgi:hypothetical protein